VFWHGEDTEFHDGDPLYENDESEGV